MRLKLRVKVRLILGALTEKKYCVFCGCVEGVGGIK